MSRSRPIPLACAAMCFTPWAYADEQPAESPIETPAPIVDEGYSLVWQDEFEGDTLDASKWTIWSPGPRRDAINTADSISLDGEGNLSISVNRHEDENGKTTYHTGGVWTKETYLAKYGYFECRIKVQDEIGFWSAFWMNSPRMGKDIGDPANAGVEIDVMEAIAGGEFRDMVMNTIHWDGYGKEHKSDHHKSRVENLHTEWHTFALRWTPDWLVFYTDGRETFRTAKAVPRIAQFMLLSCEVGTWGGQIADAELPAEVLVDWVRVWQREEPADPPGDGSD